MPRFVIDAESVTLTHDELTKFATIVQSACRPEQQHRMSIWLSGVPGPQPGPVQEFAVSQARVMWREGAKL
jgi:hypothetical protein